MLVRFVRDSLRRAPRRKALLIAAIAMGSAVATSMLGVMLSIGDKINRELREAGANIVVTRQVAAAGYIDEADVAKIGKIFWALNILGVAPSLDGQDGETALSGVDFAGLKKVNPAWRVDGRWAASDSECMVGQGVAARRGWKAGAAIPVLGAQFLVAGVISAGDEADDRVLVPLHRLQALTNRGGAVDRIDVAALTKPEDAFARKDPKSMTAVEYERWSCTNYVTVIAKEIREAIPGTDARAIRRVADSEGRILDRIGGLMALITLAALISAGLTVWSLTATTMMERRGEIAIMQAIGGARWLVAAMFCVEMAALGITGGVLGSVAGVWLVKYVGASVFHDAVEISPVLPIAIMPAAMLVALLGAAQPLRRTLLLEPAAVLRGGV